MARRPTVLSGEVQRAGRPAGGVYVRVLDAGGEFTGEQRTGVDGAFRFHLSPGRWSIVAFAAGSERAVRDVTLDEGDERTLEVTLANR
jgi:hypothetical protein